MVTSYVAQLCISVKYPHPRSVFMDPVESDLVEISFSKFSLVQEVKFTWVYQ